MEDQEPDDIVVLNVGGVRHETLRSTLAKLPGSKLARLEQLHDHFRPDKNEYFFDRHPQIFTAVLNFYRVGELHVPTDFCSAILRQELAFWELEATSLERCCLVRYSEQLVRQRTLEKLDNTTILLQAKQKPGRQGDSSCVLGSQRCCNKVWTFLDEPHSSKGAKLFALVSSLLVFVSIITLCLETHPSFRLEVPIQDTDSGVKPTEIDILQLANNNTDNNTDNDVIDVQSTQASGTHDKRHQKRRAAFGRSSDVVLRPTENEQGPYSAARRKKGRKWQRGGGWPREERPENLTSSAAGREGVRTVPHPVMDLVDLVCHVWFAVEVLMRFFFCPYKRLFCLNVLNMVDVVSILPFYVELVVNTLQVRQRYATSVMHGLLVLRVLRIVRVVRLLRHSRGLQVLAFTIRASIREIFLMLCFLTLAMIVFSTLAYHADTHTFISIPHAFWWAIVTMTTVGYGDLVPATNMGYMVGAVCAVCGVLVIAFTVPVIVGNFMLFYQYVEYGRNCQGNRVEQVLEPTDSCVPSRSTSGSPTPV